MATAAASVYPSLENRPLKGTVVLFDVDKTLSPARGVSSQLKLLLNTFDTKHLLIGPKHEIERFPRDANAPLATPPQVRNWLCQCLILLQIEYFEDGVPDYEFKH